MADLGVHDGVPAEVNKEELAVGRENIDQLIHLLLPQAVAAQVQMLERFVLLDEHQKPIEA